MPEGQSRPRLSRERGFSMTELLVVLMLFGIFMLIAIPNISRWYASYVLNNSSREMVSMFKLARMKAVAQNRQYDARVSEDTDYSKIRIEIYPTSDSTNVTETTLLHKHVRLDPGRYYPLTPNPLKTTFTYRPNGTVIFKDTSNAELSSAEYVQISLSNLRNPDLFNQQTELYFSGGAKVKDIE